MRTGILGFPKFIGLNHSFLVDRFGFQAHRAVPLRRNPMVTASEENPLWPLRQLPQKVGQYQEEVA